MGQELMDRGRGGEAQTQRHQVGNTAENGLGLGGARDRRADQQVALSAVASQEKSEGGKENHKGSETLGKGEGAQ
jgi:hypothetical protein